MEAIFSIDRGISAKSITVLTPKSGPQDTRLALHGGFTL